MASAKPIAIPHSMRARNVGRLRPCSGTPIPPSLCTASCRGRRRVSWSWLPGAESLLWMLLGELLRHEPARPGVAVPTGLVGLLLALCHRSSSRSAVVSVRRFVRYLIGRRAALLKSRRGSNWTLYTSDVRPRPRIGRAVAARWTVVSRHSDTARTRRSRGLKRAPSRSGRCVGCALCIAERHCRQCGRPRRLTTVDHERQHQARCRARRDADRKVARACYRTLGA